MIGEVVKDYRIVSFLGEGGMGTVYRAEHRLIGKPAVVKVLRSQMSADEGAVRRFMNEAMAAARIGHPGIVAVFDFGFHASGEAYIVMEFLQGEPLSGRIGRDGRLDTVSAVRFLKQIAGALSAAARVGIIHRDLKPDNVFLTPDPDMEGGERAKILDFGIAKIAGDPTAIQSFTRTSALMGTPYYMSPEQCRSARDADHRSDLYAVGCIGYEMLCGRPPFTAESLWELLRQHQFVEPQLPSALAPQVPSALEAVIVTLLAKEPAHRYQSADALGAALSHVLEQLPSSAFALTRHASLPLPVSPAPSGRLLRSSPMVRSGPIASGPDVATVRARIDVPVVAPVVPAATTLSLGMAVRHSDSHEAVAREDPRNSARVTPRARRWIVAAVLLAGVAVGLMSMLLARPQSAEVVVRGGDMSSEDAAGHLGPTDAPSVVDGQRESDAGEAVDAGIDAGIDTPDPRLEERRHPRPARVPEAARRGSSPAVAQPSPQGGQPHSAAPVSQTTTASSSGSASLNCANGGAPAGQEDQAKWHAQCNRHKEAATIYAAIARTVESSSEEKRLLGLAKDQYKLDGNLDQAYRTEQRIEDLNRRSR